MASGLMEYECPACGGPLKFNATKQMLTCEFCGSDYPEDIFAQTEAQATAEANDAKTAAGVAGVGADLAQNPEQEAELDEHGMPVKLNIDFDAELSNRDTLQGHTLVSCKSCGAEIVSNAETVSTECLYCGNPVVLQQNVRGVVRPDYVLPFKIEKKDAVNILKDFYKGKKLLPNEFKNNNKIEKIAGVYVPFWMFNCESEADLQFTGVNLRTWSDSEYNYTESSYYNVRRAGNMQFDKVPVDASIKMEDNFMDGIEPFDYSEIKDFSPMYLAGYYADKYDVNVEDCTNRIKLRVENTLVSELKASANYDTLTTKNAEKSLNINEVKYALIPVWMLNTRYNGVMYQFAINGQTGKVSGILPIDKGKLSMYKLGAGAIAGLVSYLVALMFFV